jgi:multidrug transporter EmrE-like cation transporter
MISERLSLFQIAALAAYSLGMAGGQILFKFAAIRSNPTLSLAERFYDLIQNGYFLTALVAYGGLSILWVWILTITPLSRAYPFVALAFVLTPLLGGLLFDEVITMRVIAGMALILCGLFLVTG